MGLGSAREYVMLCRLLASGKLTPEQRARVQAEMGEIRESMLTQEVHEMRPRRNVSRCWAVAMLVLAGLAAIVWVIVWHCTLRVPTRSEIVVGARLYHYNPWRSKEYMGMDVTAVYDDGRVELAGAGFLGWMAGVETTTIDRLTDGHRRNLRTEWVTR